jgi:hypothetical protein
MEVCAMAKLQLVENHTQSDLNALIMEQAEKEELDAMRQRMKSLLYDFYTDNVHTGNFQGGLNAIQNEKAATNIHAAQGDTHDHKD